MNTDVRKLVKIVTIDDVMPAHNADALELVIVGGWQVVVRKDQNFKKGEKAVYAEIDSCIPVNDHRFNFGENIIKQASTVNDKKVLKVKTIKLRGNLSQGIVFPVENFGFEDYKVGTDVTEELNIFKFNPPVSVGVIGNFDSRVAQVSDSERIQNLTEVWDTICEHKWVATEKIDGQSITIANDEGKVRLFGRNRELNPEGHNVFKVISSEEFLEKVPEGFALQGEFFGGKIQKNKLKIDGNDFKVFKVFENGREVPLDEWPQVAVDMRVPILDIDPTKYTVNELIELVDGMKSTITPNVLAEGVVFHETNGAIIPELGRSTFKVISNKFLLKDK